MERRLAISIRAFYVGLAMMLAAGIGSAALDNVFRMLPVGLMLAGALLAVIARLWGRRLRRRAWRLDACDEIGGYPMHVLRDPRFMNRRRHVA